ncbi:MAG: prepilin-type N-terminal cleavage/methylation domain-containing protein [Lachnospiraceae bacterium]|nr:prepilin-type N-terminal cleavage/methylation domain-containing protein [Lachnospiraceae bacterium]MDE6234001.1 prepilin-type N-terminal cleavage/methylation domain-containing protein [Lachnospiraceae bacterium]MDE6253729.1 prepilin-type N-terminal cleavage/methylation domain-containing protein [Lachnospiraceae bacterium]
MRKKINCNSGFSLIELLVGLAISCIVLVAAYSFVLSGINSYEMTRKTTELQQETQFIENIIVDAVENGKWGTSVISDTPSGITFKTGDAKKVLYYFKGKDTLAIYDDGDSDIGDESVVDTHLVSKHVTSFKVTYINQELATDGSYIEAAASGDKTGLVKVELKVEMNGKTDSSAKQYKFRNE